MTVFVCAPLRAQTVTAGVNVNGTLAVMPEYGLGIHASVYDNSLQYNGSAVFNQLDGLLDAAGVNVLRYPGGGYADVFHFSVSRPGGLGGYGTSPWWGPEGMAAGAYGYMGPRTDFGNFIRLLDGTNSKTIITVNTASALKYDTPANRLTVPTHNGQPQEAAAWVAYANADPSIYQTAADVVLGVDAEGNDWKTAGYWARLRASTSGEYATWATTDGVYDAHNAFLAIDRDAPVGIEYWEIGNETFGTGYYGGQPRNTDVPIREDFAYTQYALNYAVPYDGLARNGNPLLSPAAYGQQVLDFNAAMKAVDPNIKIGAVLVTPPGDYSYAPQWNDEVLSRTDAGLGKVADNVDFVIAHWYPSGNSTSILSQPRTTIPLMINGTTSGLDTGTNAGLRDSIARWRSDGAAQGLEILITETDGYGGSNQRSDGLFAADEYATFLEHGVSNVDWLELHNGSFLSESSNAPNFAYWGIQSMHLLAGIGDELVATTTSEDNLRIHAARQADGAVAVMIINMNGTNGGTRTVNVSINGDLLAADGVRYETDGDTALSMTSLGGLGNSFSTSIAGRTLQLFVIPRLALVGDFNGDGTVDAADYTVWRNGLGNDYDEDDYNDWKANFGRSIGGMGGLAGLAESSPGAVPEPSPLALALCAIAISAARVGRRPDSPVA